MEIQTSALEWILDQYREKKPKATTIAEKFSNCRFSDYKSQVIYLLKRVCTVSIETMKIIDEMKKQNRLPACAAYEQAGSLFYSSFTNFCPLQNLIEECKN